MKSQKSRALIGDEAEVCNYYNNEFHCMGTIIQQSLLHEKAKEISEAVEAEMRRIEDIMSFFLPYSDISNINNASGESAIKVDIDTLTVIKNAVYFSEITGGAFDITAGPLIKLWGIFTKNERVPSEEEIKEKLELINYKDILIDEKSQTVMLSKLGQKIDLGAVAKGFAADRAIEIYRRYGVKSALINLGGNVKVLGNNHKNKEWKIGIQDPFKPRGQYLGIVRLTDKSVVTSGAYERYFDYGNTRYHHILDPKSGYSSRSNLISATVIEEKSIAADALSTACFVLGLEKSLEIINTQEGAEGIFITEDKKIYVTKGIKESFILASV